MGAPEETEHWNIPDPEVRRVYRGRLAELAERTAKEQQVDLDDVWGEAAGPGSYRWEWTRFIRLAPQVSGFLALAISIAGLVGWLFDVEFLVGDYLGGESFPATSAAMLALLAGALLLMREGASSVSLRYGTAVAWLVLIIGVPLLILDIGGLTPVEWGNGALRSPSIAALFNIPIMALCLITVDRDAPRYRWQRVLMPVTGFVFLIALVSRSYLAVIGNEATAALSYQGSIALVLVYLGYALMRPRRGLAWFLAASGPGPSLARLLVPTALAIPLVMIGVELFAEDLNAREASLIRGLDKILMLMVLLWMITYTSRRLQGFYENWKHASSELATQANVLTRMSEGVVVSKISDSEIVLTNPQFDEMHGFERGELLGHSIDRLTPPDLSEDEVAMRYRVLEELAETGETSYEGRSKRKDGADIWSRANGVVTSVPEHGPVLILVKYDLTEQEKAKVAGRAAELRFRQVFEQSPIGLCLVKSDGGFEKVNQSFEQITGYSGEELSDMTFAEITHPDDIDEDLALSGELFAGKRDEFSMEKRYIRKNGEVVWINLTVVMLRDSEGRHFQALSMVEDITERKKMGQQLQFMADHDPLTGLYNRRRFEEDLSIAMSSGTGRGLAILVIDLDNFKFVNDSYGHSVGDQLIVQTAELLKSRLRSDDTLARQGGDEFVVVLRDIRSEDALGMAEELVGLISRDVRVVGPEHAVRVTASIGVAASCQGESVPEETLMVQADIAMYEAKDAGRNGARLFQPGENSHVTLGIDWAGRLRRALDNDELLLYAQPIVRLSEGAGSPHYELFIRMRDQSGAIIRPGAFLPTAERHDLVQEIDRWVVRKAIEVLAALDGGLKPRLQINLSGRTVGDPNLADFVHDELDTHGVDPACLIFEVTETSAIGNMTRAQEFSSRMNEMGCGFALDDFGTGFASFYYLKHLAFDYVKIDGEFVQNLATDPVNRMLVRALVRISRGMGKLTVAEQVEDARTLEMLRDFGVDFVQGYHLGRPRPLERVDLTVPPLPFEASLEN